MQMSKIKAISKELQNNENICSCAQRYGVIGDRTRLKICYLLCHYPELSVSQIAEIISAPVSTVSHSLKKLKAIHAVINHRRKKEVFYSLTQNKFTLALKHQLLNYE